MSKEGLILFVDDDPNTRKVARANLPLDGFEVVLAGDVFYEQPLAGRALAWLRGLAR